MTKRKLVRTVSLLALVIMIGGGAMHLYNKHKQEELKRNREYEVSLVKALKNSYEGIEKIEISDPDYTSPPGDWSCDIKISFSTHETISYRMGHNLDDAYSYNGYMTYKQSDFLETKKGSTKTKIKVTYSNGEKGEQ